MDINALLAMIASTAAAVPTSYIVSMFRAAKPNASTASVILVAVLAGLSMSALFGLALGTLLLTAQSGAVVVLMGIGAAAQAAGISRTDTSATRVVEGKQQ